MIHSPLFDSIKNYLKERDSERKRIFLFVPYIKTSVLEDLVDGLRGKIIIITTWKPEDLISGSSELVIYPFCKDRNITLYINNRIHLKIYSVDFADMILATANISQQGLGTTLKYNFECASLIEKITNKDRLYFAQIQKNSIHVDDKLYSQLQTWYEKQKRNTAIIEDIDEIIPLKERESFLISALPMTKSVSLLAESYEKLNNELEISDNETRDCALHDLANYGIPLQLTNEEFINRLKRSFFSHPFIKKIDSFITPEAYFGRIKEWIQMNCTDVPVPSRRELTANVQVLLEWFEKLGDGRYVVDIPGKHSQRIRRVKP
jgi:hypothetical protein